MMDTRLAASDKRQPRVRRGLAIATAGQSLVIDGGPSRQMFSGASALSLLPRLLPALDGQRSREQLCAELALSGAQLDAVIRLLDDSGLLEWTLPGNAVRFTAAHVAEYMSRTITLSEACRSADDLARHLRDAIALLVAPRPYAEAIAEDLSETGVGSVRIMTAPAAALALATMTGRCAVAVFDDPASAAALDLLAAPQPQRGFPVLRFSGSGDYAEVGPAFCGPSTACIDCFRRGQPANWSQTQQADAEQAEGGRPSAALTGVLSSLVTSAVLSILTSQLPAAPLRKLTRTVVSHRTTESRDVVPDLECAWCVGGTPPIDAASRNLLQDEWWFGQVASSLRPVDAITPARRDRIIALERERGKFPTSPRRRLPDQVSGQEINADRDRGLDESLLAGIFARVAGFRPAEADHSHATTKRWAPSGGNLASVALYVVTEQDLFGLPGTIFRYDDLEHQVLSIHADRVSLAQALDGTDLDTSNADAAIILVGEAGRLAQKYGDFAWRLTHLDTGCAALQLHLVAQDRGLRATFASSWTTRVAELLDLDQRHEIITAIAALTVAQTHERTSRECHLSLSSTPAGDYRNPSKIALRHW
jgi:SagB-type dehydrogenase family enzyme